MPPAAPTRNALLSALLLAGSCTLHPQAGRAPAPPPPRQKSDLLPIQRHEHTPGTPKPTGEHLAEWMDSHRNLTPEQQQQALEKEPGFGSLPPATQQRLRERLKQLNAMPPARQKHIISTNEWMEHLNPDQRAQVRGATQQLAALPPDQRRYVARTFRGLRGLSPEQRQNVLNSERFSTLTEAQRSTLNSLNRVEPLLPPAYDSFGEGPQATPVAAPPHP